MTRRRITVERLIISLGGVVLLLGALLLWLISRDGFGPEPPTPEARAQAQATQIIGAAARVTYTERGKRSAVCGYIVIDGVTTAFVSRPNRILLETDPLRAEFMEMQTDLCPGFLRAPPRPNAPSGGPS